MQIFLFAAATGKLLASVALRRVGLGNGRFSWKPETPAFPAATANRKRRMGCRVGWHSSQRSLSSLLQPLGKVPAPITSRQWPTLLEAANRGKAMQRGWNFSQHGCSAICCNRQGSCRLLGGLVRWRLTPLSSIKVSSFPGCGKKRRSHIDSNGKWRK